MNTVQQSIQMGYRCKLNDLLNLYLCGLDIIKYMKSFNEYMKSIYVFLQVYNLGPGTVNASEITIKWPYELASRYRHGKHLLYLMQPPQVSSQYWYHISKTMKCEIVGILLVYGAQFMT